KLTSQESFVPLAKPAQTKIFALRYIDSQSLLVMIGTSTCCITFVYFTKTTNIPNGNISLEDIGRFVVVVDVDGIDVVDIVELIHSVVNLVIILFGGNLFVVVLIKGAIVINDPFPVVIIGILDVVVVVGGGNVVEVVLIVDGIDDDDNETCSDSGCNSSINVDIVVVVSEIKSFVDVVVVASLISNGIDVVIDVATISSIVDGNCCCGGGGVSCSGKEIKSNRIKIKRKQTVFSKSIQTSIGCGRSFDDDDDVIDSIFVKFVAAAAVDIEFVVVDSD
ncbi:hypothetical protein DERP_014600, partial [Dermatophagoides pteronyssinus]